MPHVVWDWNGTLWDDLPIVVAAVNAALGSVGAGSIDPDRYRDHYMRPVSRLYESLLDRPIRRDEWTVIDRTFHDEYRRRLDSAALTRDALTALDAVQLAGGTQSLLSMWFHAELVPFVGPLGIADYMVVVDGNRGDAGETKLAHLARHLEALAAAGIGPHDVVMIGDSIDDGVAAVAAGVRCVLYDGGSHHRSDLDATGLPVARSLLEGLALAGVTG